jgi:DNA-binding MarR family transcriptional regulator
MLEAVIGLLGRLVFPHDQLRTDIMRGKRNPEAYVRGYNSCDGEHTLTQIANEVKVTPGTLSPILSDWKDRGMIYEVTRGGGKFYKRLYKLEEKRVEETKVEMAEAIPSE